MSRADVIDTICMPRVPVRGVHKYKELLVHRLTFLLSPAPPQNSTEPPEDLQRPRPERRNRLRFGRVRGVPRT